MKYIYLIQGQCLIKISETNLTLYLSLYFSCTKINKFIAFVQGNSTTKMLIKLLLQNFHHQVFNIFLLETRKPQWRRISSQTQTSICVLIINCQGNWSKTPSLIKPILLKRNFKHPLVFNRSYNRRHQHLYLLTQSFLVFQHYCSFQPQLDHDDILTDRWIILRAITLNRT